jgi:hypothetical protein
VIISVDTFAPNPISITGGVTAGTVRFTRTFALASVRSASAVARTLAFTAAFVASCAKTGAVASS